MREKVDLRESFSCWSNSRALFEEKASLEPPFGQTSLMVLSGPAKEFCYLRNLNTYF